jgi:hypothetical protein
MIFLCGSLYRIVRLGCGMQESYDQKELQRTYLDYNLIVFPTFGEEFIGHEMLLTFPLFQGDFLLWRRMQVVEIPAVFELGSFPQNTDFVFNVTSAVKKSKLS